MSTKRNERTVRSGYVFYTNEDGAETIAPHGAVIQILPNEEESLRRRTDTEPFFETYTPTDDEDLEKHTADWQAVKNQLVPPGVRSHLPDEEARGINPHQANELTDTGAEQRATTNFALTEANARRGGNPEAAGEDDDDIVLAELDDEGLHHVVNESSVGELVELVNNDPEQAQRVIDAEVAVRQDDRRKTLVAAMETIVGRDENDGEG